MKKQDWIPLRGPQDATRRIDTNLVCSGGQIEFVQIRALAAIFKKWNHGDGRRQHRDKDWHCSSSWKKQRQSLGKRWILETDWVLRGDGGLVGTPLGSLHIMTWDRILCSRCPLFYCNEMAHPNPKWVAIIKSNTFPTLPENCDNKRHISRKHTEKVNLDSTPKKSVFQMSAALSLEYLIALRSLYSAVLGCSFRPMKNYYPSSLFRGADGSPWSYHQKTTKNWWCWINACWAYGSLSAITLYCQIYESFRRTNSNSNPNAFP